MLGGQRRQQRSQSMIPTCRSRFRSTAGWRTRTSARRTKGDINPATAGLGKTEIARPAAGCTGMGEYGRASRLSPQPTSNSSPKGRQIARHVSRLAMIHGRSSPRDRSAGRTSTAILTTSRCATSASIIRSRSRSRNSTFDHYVGTNTAKNYTSLVEFKDPAHNIEREVPIWMNNPLRYSGTTFYQQSYHVDPTSGAGYRHGAASGH